MVGIGYYFLMQGVFVLHSDLEIGCLDFYSSKCRGEFSKQTMGAEAGFGPIFDWVSSYIYMCAQSIDNNIY